MDFVHGLFFRGGCFSLSAKPFLCYDLGSSVGARPAPDQVCAFPLIPVAREPGLLTQGDKALYDIAAHPTVYKSVAFRSRLEARWAAFFDIIGWRWQYEPIDFADWVPDFKVSFPCGHSQCPPCHEFHVEVKPYNSLAQFSGHPATLDVMGNRYGLDGCMLLGLSPEVARAGFAHGDGGCEFDGVELFEAWARRTGIEEDWAKAGATVQWLPRPSAPMGTV